MLSVWGTEIASSAPRVTAIERTADAYETGDTVEITVTLSAPVSGALTFPLDIGGTSLTLTAHNSKPSTKFVFSYTLQSAGVGNGAISFEAQSLWGNVDAYLHHPAGELAFAKTEARLTRLWVSSSTAVRDWYTAGETILISAQFDEPVTAVGTPWIAIYPDSANRVVGVTSWRAEYKPAMSSGNTLVFGYTVQEGDSSPPGIWIGSSNDTFQLDSANAIIDPTRPEGRRLRFVLTHAPLGTLSSHRVRTFPRVSSVEVTSIPTNGTNSDTYNAGDTIEFTVTFNQRVTVSGDPEFEFFVGSSNSRKAAYIASRSSDNTLVFTYTVIAGDTDTDGLFIEEHDTNTTTIHLDSNDSIVSANVGQNAVLAFAEPGLQSGHKID